MYPLVSVSDQIFIYVSNFQDRPLQRERKVNWCFILANNDLQSCIEQKHFCFMLNFRIYADSFMPVLIRSKSNFTCIFLTMILKKFRFKNRKIKINIK